MLDTPSAEAPIRLDNAFQTLFSQSPIGMAISTMADGLFIAANPPYCTITGYRSDELLGRTSAELDLLDSQSRALILEHVTREGHVRDIDVNLRTKAGKSVVVVASIHQAKVNGTDCFVTTVMDATWRRTVEADLKTLNDTLELRVADRTANLEEALLHLQASREELTRSETKATLSTLVAGVTHELGSPLGNGALAAETLGQQAKAFKRKMEQGALSRKELADFVDSMLTGADLAQRNLQRAEALLQKFKQVAADQASEQCRSFDLADVLEDIVQTMAPSLRRHAHRVDMRVPRHIVMKSQPGAIGQIAINLINNAYLHAFESRPDGVLTIDAAVSDGQVVLRFADNGIGIAPAHLPNLFKPFFSTKIGKGGTGLGMAIVENLVTKSLRGSIQVHTEVGVGTTFEITLPLALTATA
jgi:PAS domain S-box-containing protein